MRPHVVVATLDTGANLFHPAWRRDEHRHPASFIPGFPRTAVPARLTFASSYDDSVEASGPALELLKGSSRRLVFVPGTNIIGAWADDSDATPVMDLRPKITARSHSHGGQASSQIAGRGLGLAEDAYLVIVDRTNDGPMFDPYAINAKALRWAADQPWIDIIHTNIQNPVPLAGRAGNAPGFEGYPEAVAYAVAKGKVVVSAAGNHFAEPTETSPHAGPPSVLVAGANDNCGFTDFSNLNPHVVMDGVGTVSADPVGLGTKRFGGTSSASPRTAGYVAELLLRIRRQYGYTGGVQAGSLVVLAAGQRRPATGPLADGRLTAQELHEVVRHTANPQSHASRFDGTGSTCVPQTVTGAAAYPKIGYGEVSEHTINAAVQVIRGVRPLPLRPQEDAVFDVSDRLRRTAWE